MEAAQSGEVPPALQLPGRWVDAPCCRCELLIRGVNLSRGCLHVSPLHQRPGSKNLKLKLKLRQEAAEEEEEVKGLIHISTPVEVQSISTVTFSHEKLLKLNKAT